MSYSYSSFTVFFHINVSFMACCHASGYSIGFPISWSLMKSYSCSSSTFSSSFSFCLSFFNSSFSWAVLSACMVFLCSISRSSRTITGQTEFGSIPSSGLLHTASGCPWRTAVMKGGWEIVNLLARPTRRTRTEDSTVGSFRSFLIWCVRFFS